ncbi:MAG: SIS domain-containing protein [Phycisphaeraceae bacterium]|nr:SIS domain-containing protein [Phycisphaeraceae bacterium]
MPPDTRSLIIGALQDARRCLDAAIARQADIDQLSDLATRIAECMRAGGRVLIAGNGGSACDAMHFAEELTGRFRNDRPPLPAMALTDPGHITCTANDYGFDQVFSRLVEAHGRAGDVLILLSTSGNSPNLIRALAAGRARDMHIAVFLGRDGGALRGHADVEWIVPGETSDRIQELHMLLLHALVEAIEAELIR